MNEISQSASLTLASSDTDQLAFVREQSLETLAHYGRSFYFASHFLPRAVRGDAAVLYAFCRLVDDTVDEARDPQQAKLEMKRIRAELHGESGRASRTGGDGNGSSGGDSCGDGAGAGNGDGAAHVDGARPLIRAVRALLTHYQIDRRLPLLLIEGVEQDQGPIQFQTMNELFRYSYRVASAVGLMMCGLMGVRDAGALPYAVDLGLAMQLTNIARDITEDAQRGRRYIPPCIHVSEILARADFFYRRARRGYSAIPIRSRLGVAVAAEVYRAIGRVVERDVVLALQRRARTTRWQKLRAACVGLALFLVSLSNSRKGLGKLPATPLPFHESLRGNPGISQDGEILGLG